MSKHKYIQYKNVLMSMLYIYIHMLYTHICICIYMYMIFCLCHCYNIMNHRISILDKLVTCPVLIKIHFVFLGTLVLLTNYSYKKLDASYPSYIHINYLLLLQLILLQ